MIYTFRIADAGANLIFSLRSRISSMPRFEAASISSISKFVPLVIDIHCSHTLQGSTDWLIAKGFELRVDFVFCSLPFAPIESGFAPPSQLTAFARILAADVLPKPLGPVNKKAWGKSGKERIEYKEFLTDSLSSSFIVCGRYFR